MGTGSGRTYQNEHLPPKLDRLLVRTTLTTSGRPVTAHVPASLDAAPAASQPLLSKVQAQLGSLPNFFRLLATSPAALTGYLDLGAALGQGELDLKTRERIALAVSKANSCD